MFFLFHGDDTAKARSVAQKNIAAAQKKHDSAEFFKLSPENFSEDKLTELVASQGLFYSASIIFADNLCDDVEVSEKLLKKIKEIKESPNFFVFLEKKLNKKELDKFKKYAEKVEEFTKPEKKLSKKEELALKGEKIDFFEFANALGEKNKRLLWSLYQDALDESVPSEEVHGIFFWQVKAMLSALKSRDAGEAGLNPYVFTKSKNYGQNYGESKLKAMSASLFDMYHQAHRGEIDFPIALERFILEI
jgi:hypothetical protein